MEKFELRKVRDFSDLITDTFQFLKLTWKPFLLTFFSICGFFIVAAMVLSVVQQLKAAELLNGQSVRTVDAASMLRNTFGVEYIMLLLVSMMEYIAIPLTVFCFIALYEQNDGQTPTTADVWSFFKYYFFRFLGAWLVTLLLQLVAFLFLFFPGLWLMPIAALIIAILVFENGSFGYSFGRGFSLISGHWWETFGALFVMGIVVISAQMIFSLPTMVITMGSVFTGSVKTTFSTWKIILTALQHLCVVFYVLPYITIALAYFSLVEQKESAGLEEKIRKFGLESQEPPLADQ